MITLLTLLGSIPHEVQNLHIFRQELSNRFKFGTIWYSVEHSGNRGWSCSCSVPPAHALVISRRESGTSLEHSGLELLLFSSTSASIGLIPCGRLRA
ncbi:hypothetical protein EMCRGX_G010226 [Ephydatia muelleri]